MIKSHMGVVRLPWLTLLVSRVQYLLAGDTMDRSSYLSITSAIPLALALAACGGGSGGPGGPGGGGGGTFLGFSQIQPGTTTLTGIGNVATAGATSIALSDAQDATIDVTYNNEMELTGADLTVGSAHTVWNENNSEENEDPSVPSNLYVADRSKDDSGGFIAFARPDVSGFEYQTYGAWVDEVNGTPSAGGFSIGREAPDQLAAAEAQDGATFTGTAAGIYVDGTTDADDDLNRYAYTSAASLTVDSAHKKMGFATTGSQTRLIGDSGLGTATAAGNLDMAGDLVYDSGSKNFTGTVANANHDMSGTASGRFYGPAGEEAGGVFGLQDSANVKTLIGGFGTKK